MGNAQLRQTREENPVEVVAEGTSSPQKASKAADEQGL